MPCHIKFKNSDWNEGSLFQPPPPQPPLSYKWNPITYGNKYSPRIDYNRQLQQYSRNFFQQNNQQMRRVGRSIMNRNVPYEEWEHHQAHRDRRDLYESILAASPL